MTDKKKTLEEMLPELERAIIEYQQRKGVEVKALIPVMARFSALMPVEIIRLDIEQIQKIHK